MSQNKNSLLLNASLVLFLAVALGAFGAHGLEKTLSEKALKTFHTGVRYQFYHGFALLFLGLAFETFKEAKLKNIGNFFLLGIFLFSVNCYLYAVTGVKAFALIVPFGGLSFLAGWALLILFFLKRSSR